MRESRAFEEGGSVVEDEVDTSKLLKTLKGASSKETLAEVTFVGEQIAIGSLAKGHFVLMVGANFVQFCYNFGMIRRQSAKTA